MKARYPQSRVGRKQTVSEVSNRYFPQSVVLKIQIPKLFEEAIKRCDDN